MRRSRRLTVPRPLVAMVDPLLWSLPFVVMITVALIDLLAGPRLGVLPLLAVGPAFSGLGAGIRQTIMVGALAMAIDISLSIHDSALGTVESSLTLLFIVAVTLASVLVSVRRQRRDRELAMVRIVAEVAQRVLLRPIPKTAGTLQIAVRYISAAPEARIGGDLYEVSDTPFGVRVIVGDVQGKGLHAVETAATVLASFRIGAYEQPDLPALAGRLETTLGRLMPGEKFVTGVLAEFTDGNAVLLNSGHPPPLVLPYSGDCYFAEPAEASPPLGMQELVSSAPQPYRIDFRTGDQILFYTDGVVEARSQDGRFYPLRERATAILRFETGEDAVEALQADLLRHAGGSISDDAAMLLIRHR